MTAPTPGEKLEAAGRLILIACALVAFCVAFFAARSYGIDRSDPSNRMRYHAIPVAISQIYHGRPHDYTGFKSIAMQFQSDYPLGKLIIQMTRAKVASDDAPYFWTADDRGLSDFVNGAFRLFGPRMKALYYFWFLLLGLSLAAALIRFRNDRIALAAVACTTVAIGATFPLYVRAPGLNFAELSVHISESRMLEILGALAAVHAILLLVRPPDANRLVENATLAVQTGLLAFLLHARMSLVWVFAAIGILAVMYLAVLWRRGQRSMQPLRVIAALVIGYIAVVALQAATFHPTYKSNLGARTVWHNALMGLSYDPTIAKSINIFSVDDAAVVESVIQDMKARSDLRLTPDWNRTTILNSFGGHNPFDWQTYEAVARSLVFRTIARYPAETLRMIVWDKPVNIYRIVTCQAMLIRCEASAMSWARFAPLSATSLVLLGAVIAGLCVGTPLYAAASTATAIAIVFGGTAILALLGLFPSLAFYPAITQLAGTLVFGTLATYLIIVAGFLYLYAWLLRQRGGRRVETGAAKAGV